MDTAVTWRTAARWSWRRPARIARPARSSAADLARRAACTAAEKEPENNAAGCGGATRQLAKEGRGGGLDLAFGRSGLLERIGILRVHGQGDRCAGSGDQRARKNDAGRGAAHHRQQALRADGDCANRGAADRGVVGGRAAIAVWQVRPGLRWRESAQVTRI